MTTDLAVHHAGKASTRATVHVALQVGLINIPLSLFKGADDESKVSRSTFTADGHPMGMKPYDKTTGAVLAQGDVVVKKYELAPNQWVELSDDELESVLGAGVKGAAEVETFIPLSAIGREYFVLDTQQVRPAKVDAKKGKVDNPGTVKAFSVIRAAMAAAGVAALCKITMRSVTRYAAFTPDGLVHLLAYAEQVRERLPLPEAEYSDREFELATTMIHDVVGVDTPVLTDTDLAKVLAYVEAKAGGADTVEAAKDVVEPEAEVQDMTALLEAAVAAARAAKESKGVAA